MLTCLLRTFFCCACVFAVDRLRLVLNAEEYEYTDLASHGTGLRIAFHSHDERPAQPEIVRGATLAVGTHAHISFRSLGVSLDP